MGVMTSEERPGLRRPARLKYDKTRQMNMLLLPERVVNLNKTAGDILERCDGKRTVAEIIDELEVKYRQANLRIDIMEFLKLAVDKGWVEI